MNSANSQTSEAPVEAREASASFLGRLFQLKDDDGNASALREEELALIISAQNGVYISSYLVDIEGDRLTELKQTKRASAVAKEGLGAQEALNALNVNLIDRSSHDKVSRFIDLGTLPVRLGHENSIDCEFLSVTDKGWCRASWLPVLRDDAGAVVHALFVVSSIDAAAECEIVREREFSELMALHYEAARTIFDSKVLALGLFSRETGEGRKWHRSTQFSQPVEATFEQMMGQGLSLVPADERKRLSGLANRESVIREIDECGTFCIPASFEDALGAQRHLIHHFSPFERDASLIMAVVEDATERLEQQRRLAATTRSLKVVLESSNKMAWEYDLTDSTMTCYTEGNAFGLPRVIEGCPDSLESFDALCAEDLDAFRHAVKRIEDGEDVAHCDARILVDGELRWFSCSFYVIPDTVNGHKTAMLFVSDISLRVAARRSFEERVESLIYSDSAVLKAGVYNVSKDAVAEVYTKDSPLLDKGLIHPFDECLSVIARGIIGEAERQLFFSSFSRSSLRSLAESGETRRSMECLYQEVPGHTIWVEVSAEVTKNPVSGDIESIGRMRDISELRCSELLVDRSLRHFDSAAAVIFNEGEEFYLFDGKSEPVCTHHLDYWGALSKMLDAACPQDDRQKAAALLNRDTVLSSLAAGREVKASLTVNRSGSLRRIEVSYSIVDKDLGIIFVAVRDVTDEEMTARIRHISRHDELTDLYNRRTLFARCGELLREHPGESFAMVKLNVRRFRMFNEFFGEKAGDKLLCDIADKLLTIARDYPFSVYGRIESDIFCGFFPYDEELLLRHIGLVDSFFARYRDDFRLEPSIGVCVTNDAGLSAENMFARASSAAKEGGSKICDYAWRYDAQLEKKLDREVRITNEMHSALEQGQFVLYLQPKFNLGTGEHAGAEALVRWVHPKHGMVSPGLFIPVFEGNGFISSLDRFVWESTCALLRRWLDEGRDVKPISVNVSRVSAYSPVTPGFLRRLVRRYDIDPALLELELTESAYIDDPDQIENGMRDLQASGFRILMDDFGSGYSSLNTLRNLPVDVLKLDMGFLSGEKDDERGRTVVASMLSMTKKLRLPVIAEGVETQDQADFLKSEGCEYVQGYLFAKPMPVEEYERMV